MKPLIKAWAIMFLLASASMPAKADLLGVAPGVPQVSFIGFDPNSLTYDTNTQVFSVGALPVNIIFSAFDSGTLFSTTNKSIEIQIDTDGNLISGTNGFLLTGDFTYISGGVTNVYSGTLLQGDVTAFGYLSLGSESQFDFRVHLTGGQMVSLFNCAGGDFAITLDSEGANFTGSFATPFNGPVKGICGPNDTTPPEITCPPLSSIVTTPATDPADPTIQGFIVTYPDPVVTDNCDPAPQVFADTPSGSFVALNPGDSLTINIFGIDASGNFSQCSFTVVMGATNSCVLAYTDSGCAPTTLSTDPGKCSATYSFGLPAATNCTGQAFIAAATAVNENGGTIALTTLTNGMLRGIFPKTTTTNGDIITFTVSDGQGNSLVRQCQVFVQDNQPPTIFCMNQCATFKPILTNALSCIDAQFDPGCITQSNYIWFSSVIQNLQPRYNGKPFTVHMFESTIQLFVDNTNVTLNVPEAYVTFSNNVPVATTVFTNGQWVTVVSTSFGGKAFLSGLSWQIPFNLNNVLGNCWGRDRDYGCFRRQVKSATWCARFAVDTPGVALAWQWSAVVSKTMTTNCNALCVKPVDDNCSSSCRNNDPAGSCEAFKSCLLAGAMGKGCYYTYNRQPVYDCTGILSPEERINLGKGIICEGAVDFKTPVAADNCDNSVTVTCNPPSGSIFGPGNHTIVATAVDSSGNTNECSFTLTVLAPLQVVFDSPYCDNIVDNTAEKDSGFTDFNCPDDPATSEYVTCFHVGDKICHQVRLLDCNGNDVTSSLGSCVTVHIDVTERQGSYANSVLVSDVTQRYSGIGSPGSIMVPCNGEFLYNLDTTGYQARTVNTSRFFRSCVWVEYNSSPGIPVGMEDVLLQSQ